MGDSCSKATHAGQFPGLAQRINGAPLAYLDNAATTHMPQAVLRRAAGLRGRQPGQHPPRRAHAQPALDRGLRSGARHAQALRRRRPGARAGVHLRHHRSAEPGGPRPVGFGPRPRRAAAGRRDRGQRTGAPRQPGALAGRRAPQRREAARAAPGRAGSPACRRPGPVAGPAHPRLRHHRLRQCHRRAAALRSAAVAGGGSRCADRAGCRAGGCARGAGVDGPRMRLHGLLRPQDVRPDGHGRAGRPARGAGAAGAAAAGRRHGRVGERAGRHLCRTAGAAGRRHAECRRRDRHGGGGGLHRFASGARRSTPMCARCVPMPCRCCRR